MKSQKLLWQCFIHLNAKVGIDDDTDEDVKALTDAANQQDESQGAIFNQTLAKTYALHFSTLNPLSPNIHIQILQTGLYTFP